MKKVRNPFHGADDNLFGLLAAYKMYNTYIRVLYSEEKKSIAFQLTSNPKFWHPGDENFTSFRAMSRLELDSSRLFIKFVLPEHILNVMGPLVGLKIAEKNVTIYDNLQTSGVYTLEVSVRFRKRIIEGVHRLVKLSSRKKYEILEKNHISSDVEESV